MGSIGGRLVLMFLFRPQGLAAGARGVSGDEPGLKCSDARDATRGLLAAGQGVSRIASCCEAFLCDLSLVFIY
ncbi:hypothetical protein OE88DRAFT_1658015 [Heliocybe sulcata]|uniref:Secreted protein n=1 Tax=Heliocybe sulcata TaxID=5364 RepID=A0A5C3N628_9AGAM|nr:hypothetical protein OE88DRAFT_1658015 [Heliocybe sulcata]